MDNAHQINDALNYLYKKYQIKKAVMLTNQKNFVKKIKRVKVLFKKFYLY